ncbi:MAG: prevent-host-death protein [Propionibacteriaceae bacterium]|nr:prevent-host-death protein [Propionibacteriaceae bacterium]
MVTITQRQLRNESAQIMDRLEHGDSFIVTRNGRAVGTLAPISGPRQAVPSDELVAALSDLPPLDYARLRADGDRFFADEGDRIE